LQSTRFLADLWTKRQLFALDFGENLFANRNASLSLFFVGQEVIGSRFLSTDALQIVVRDFCAGTIGGEGAFGYFSLLG
jgi:hypothetical protein